MSSSRRRRIVASLVALPMAATFFPNVALAAQITLTPLDVPFRTVGPNAGFYDPTQGVKGSTPVFRVVIDDSAARVEKVGLEISGQSLSLYRDFAAGDGFALFPDRNADGQFTEVDHTAGPASGGWTVGIPSGGKSPVTVIVDPAKATGFSSYFVTVHPNPGVSLPNRVFTPAIARNGIQTSVGSEPGGPFEALPLIIDSLAPPAPNTGNFTVARRAPGLNDGYVVAAGEYNSDPGKLLGFFNGAEATAPEALLRLPGGAPAVYPAPIAPTELSIGDGTGVNSASKVALNNQLINDVYVRALDPIGNVSAAARLYTDTADNNPDKGNDVTAPVVDALDPGLGGNPVAVGINAANQAAVPVDATVTSASAELGGNDLIGTEIFLTGFAEHRLSLIDPVTRMAISSTAWSKVRLDSFPDPTGFGLIGYTAPGTIDSRGLVGEGQQVVVQTRITDEIGNASVTVDSGCDIPTPNVDAKCTTLKPYIKDTTPPSIVGVYPLSGYGDGPSAGDTLKVFFSEPMQISDISNTTTNSTCVPSDPFGELPSKCVTFALPVTDSAESLPVGASVSYGGTAVEDGTRAQNGTPGTAPGWSWDTGGSSATLTLGTLAPGAPLRRYPTEGDLVGPSTGFEPINDVVGNTMTSLAPVIFGGLLPVSAITRDAIARANPFNIIQPGDGYLDGVEVVMNGNVLPDSLFAALPNVELVANGQVVKPESLSLVAPNTIRLNLPADSRVDGGQAPTIVLRGDANGLTGLLSSEGKTIRPFSIVAADVVAPMLLSGKTADADRNGKIDSATLTYSEVVNFAKGDPLQYKVSGYEDTDAIGVDGTVGITKTNSHTPGPPTGAPGRVSTVLLAENADATKFDTDAVPPASYARRTSSAAQPNANVPNLQLGVQDFAKPGAAPLGLPITGLPVAQTSGNMLGGWGMSFLTDGAPPVLLSRLTRDLDGDGLVDAVDLKYSEPLETSSLEQAIFELGDRAYLGAQPLSANDVRLFFAEATTALLGDTDAKVAVHYLGGENGGLRDASAPEPNPAAPEAGPTDALDGAGPAIMAASANFTGEVGKAGTGEELKVIFSEQPAGVEAADFVVKQGTRTITPKEIKAAEGDSKAVILVLDPKISPFDFATVALTSVGAVTDAATPANPSTQVGLATAVPFPLATLNVQGPEGSPEGVSRTKELFTGAGANSVVTGWLLAAVPAGEVVPAPTKSDDPRFVEARPDVLTVDLEGTYDIYLWTRDAFGNVSAQAKDSIYVDGTAPAVSTPKFLNLTTGSATAVRDDDTFNLSVTTTGLDAGAASKGYSATADYSALTNNPADASLAPVKTESPSSSRRDFTFPTRRVTGTTVYPTGSVLRVVGDSGPGSMLEDGANGQQVRRRFVSSAAMRSHGIPETQVITVPSAVLSRIPVGPSKGFRDGLLVRSSSGPQVSIVSEGRRRALSGSVFNGLGFTLRNVLVLSPGEYSLIPAGAAVTSSRVHPIGTMLLNVDTNRYYQVVKRANGSLAKQLLTGRVAAISRVTEAEIVRVRANHTSMTIPSESTRMGLRDGMLIRVGDARVFVVSRGVRRQILSGTVLAQMGFNTRNVKLVSIGDLATTTIGPGISSRPLGYTITIRDFAGNVTTKTGTVTALGTPDPLPAPPAAS